MERSLLGVVCLVVLLSACATNAPSPNYSNGRAVFMVADAAADMGTISKVEVTIDRVEVHSAEKGWMTVSSGAKTYDLMELRASGDTVAIADVQLQEGSYDQVRMSIMQVVVTDADGGHDVKLPSNELKIVGTTNVEAGKTSAVTFDFIADQSLHKTGQGEYIMAPVVKFESRSDAQVEVDNRNEARVSGGRVQTSNTYSMDVDGDVNLGVNIGVRDKLAIIGGKIILGKDCMCTAQYDPVCGADEHTYGNACEADCAGVQHSPGQCPPNDLAVNIGSSGNVNSY